MHPQNRTAISELDTLLFTVALDPSSLPKALHYFYRFLSCQKADKLPPERVQPHLEHSYSVYSPSTVSAMLKVASNKRITIP